MRIRLLAFAALTLLLATFVTLAGPNTGVRAQDDATPEADGTPVGDEGEDENEARGRIATLVGWYSRDESGDFLVIGPLQTNENLVAGPVSNPGSALTGTVDFDSEANDDLPRIEIGDTVFDAYSPFDDESSQFWTYFDGDPELRPATLVMQVEVTEGPAEYEGAIGTATFISRDQDGNGVIVIVLNLSEE
ncbi:MAG: hypothetical protein ACRDJH_10325 [Thermomicrobiales bacterium]